MRRASGPQNGSSNFYVKKQAINKKRSPNVVKTKSRGKIIQQSNSSQMIATRKNSSFSKIQPNQSSTFFTNTTQNNKSKKSNCQTKKLKDLKKYEKQIMQILNASASVIQRQWRKYLIRKYRKSLQQKQSRQQKNNKNVQQFDSVSGRTSQHQMYNSNKYYSSLQSNKKKGSENSFHKNVFSFNLQANKQKINGSSENFGTAKQIQPYILKNTSPSHNRTRSDQPIKLLNEKIKSITKIQQKKLNIENKIINVVIKGSPRISPQKKGKKNKVLKSQRNLSQIKYEDHYVKNEKGTLDEILKKIEEKLQQKKLKKILALQNSFSNNLMTFRSYQKNIEDVAQQHSKMLTILENKKRNLIDNFNEYMNLCEKNYDQLKIQKLKQRQKQKQKQNQIQNRQGQISFNDQISGFNSRSIVFEDWEFDGQFSDKKISNISINNLQKNKQQIFINDNEKETTFINGLMSDEKNLLEQSTGKKQNHISHEHIAQIQISTPTKQQQNKQNILKEVFQPLKYPKPQVILISDPQIKQDKIKNQYLQNKDQRLFQSKISEKIQNNKIESFKTKKKIQQPQCNKEIRKKQGPIKQFNQHQVQKQLSKFHPIKPNIDLVNNWLLEVSHFILDNFGKEFLQRLICIQQPSPIQLWKHCIYKQHFNKEYISINIKVFKQFEFFHIKTLLEQEIIENEKKQSYSALMYTFHQSLYDSLNKMLMDELIQGRNWIHFPWLNQFKVKKIVNLQHPKQALQKAINRVSNISDYNIIPTDSVVMPGQQFEYAQHNLIFAQQIKQIPLQCQFQRGLFIYQVSNLVDKIIFEQEAKLLSKLFL